MALELILFFILSVIWSGKRDVTDMLKVLPSR